MSGIFGSGQVSQKHEPRPNSMNLNSGPFVNPNQYSKDKKTLPAYKKKLPQLPNISSTNIIQKSIRKGLGLPPSSIRSHQNRHVARSLAAGPPRCRGQCLHDGAVRCVATKSQQPTQSQPAESAGSSDRFSHLANSETEILPSNVTYWNRKYNH